MLAVWLKGWKGEKFDVTNNSNVKIDVYFSFIIFQNILFLPSLFPK